MSFNIVGGRPDIEPAGREGPKGFASTPVPVPVQHEVGEEFITAELIFGVDVSNLLLTICIPTTDAQSLAHDDR
jgi:hypothetical protein